jgi:hypothetical protein
MVGLYGGFSIVCISVLIMSPSVTPHSVDPTISSVIEPNASTVGRLKVRVTSGIRFRIRWELISNVLRNDGNELTVSNSLIHVQIKLKVASPLPKS